MTVIRTPRVARAAMLSPSHCAVIVLSGVTHMLVTSPTSAACVSHSVQAIPALVEGPGPRHLEQRQMQRHGL